MVRAWMQCRDDFDDEDRLLNCLATQLGKGRLALVLGAGISKPFGLPDWSGLLTRLFASKGTKCPRKMGVEQQAELYRQRYVRTHGSLVRSIHRALYARVDPSFERLRANAVIPALAALVMASRRGSVSEVISFNWDNLLELYLKYHGFVVSAVFSEIHWASACDVAVLHPHGFVPYDLREGFSGDLVFDRKSYSTVTGDDRRPWRQKVLTTMRTHLCLFVGLSGDDANLDSMLVTCKAAHTAVSDGMAFWGIRLTAERTDRIEFWEDRGVYCKQIADYKRTLAAFLFRICQTAARQSGR